MNCFARMCFKVGSQRIIICGSLIDDMEFAKRVCCDQSRRKGRSQLPPGKELIKMGPQIWLNTIVTAYGHTSTEIIKDCFHTFPLSTFIFIYVKEIDLPTIHAYLFSKTGKQFVEKRENCEMHCR